MQIVNLDAGSYMNQTSTKALVMAEQEKTEKYPYKFFGCRHSFTPMVYSTDLIPGTGGLSITEMSILTA